MFEKITALEAKGLIADNLENENFVILDVRTAHEFSTGHLENAENLDFYAENFKLKLAELDKTKTYLIYCRSGQRSGMALGIMEGLGFQKVYDMGAIIAWINQGLFVVK